MADWHLGFQRQSERDNLGMIYKDHLRYVSLTADYKLQDSFAGWKLSERDRASGPHHSGRLEQRR